MQATPKSKSSELIERLNEFSTSGSINEFQIEGLKAGARSLIRTDTFRAYGILGMIASCTYDIESLHENHEASINAPGSDPLWAYTSYAVSCTRVGDYKTAATIISEALEMYPDNLGILRDYIDYHAGAGEFTSALSACQRMQKLTPEGPEYRSCSWLMNVTETVENNEISEDAVKRAFQIFREIPASRKLLQIGTLVHSVPGNDFTYVAQLHQPASVIAELNDELADKFIDEDLIPEVSSVLTFGYMPMPSQAQ